MAVQETNELGIKAQRQANGSEIGPYENLFIARARNKAVREKGQYGGVVSALLIYALERGIITSAVLTDKGDGASPSGISVNHREGVLACAGSRYTASGGLSALNEAIRGGEQNLAVVGLPCQMNAVTRLGLIRSETDQKILPVDLKIGLFCTWALDFRSVRNYLSTENVGMKDTRYDIPPPPSQVFRVISETGNTDIPLEHLRPFIKKGCHLCGDMTAEWADISVGNVEGMEGWNTVIVRTDTGRHMIDAARENQIVETGTLPSENLAHLMEASLQKRERARGLLTGR
jgi:coenzyme F420 hydrogenase subunit beta